MFKGNITCLPFLKYKSNQFLADLLPALSPLKLAKAEFVYKEKEHPNYVYWLTHGRVNFVTGNQLVTFKSFVAGSYFGEIELLENCYRICSVRCE